MVASVERALATQTVTALASHLEHSTPHYLPPRPPPQLVRWSPCDGVLRAGRAGAQHGERVRHRRRRTHRAPRRRPGLRAVPLAASTWHRVALLDLLFGLDQPIARLARSHVASAFGAPLVAAVSGGTPARLSRAGRARGRAHASADLDVQAGHRLGAHRSPRSTRSGPAAPALRSWVVSSATMAWRTGGTVAGCTRAAPRRSSSPPRCATGSGRAISPRRSRRSRRARPGASPVMGTRRMPPDSMRNPRFSGRGPRRAGTMSHAPSICAPEGRGARTSWGVGRARPSASPVAID